jgi:RNA polymerase sigma-70 factor, ECF subfamily
MTSSEEIESLIARVALSDRKAFAALYDRTAAKLLGVALRVLGDRPGAEDALQETFVKIWRNADRYASNGLSPMTWLITIARNTTIDRRRRRGNPTTGLQAAADLPAPGPSPEASAIAASEARRLGACLDALPEDRRVAVRGAYLEGRTYAELAERSGVPLNTMRTWLRRSLLSLRECLAG